jgi:hypothetical protein
VAAAAVVVALLLVGGTWLYHRTTTPARVTSAVVQPDTQNIKNAKASSDSSEQVLLGLQEEERRKAKAEAEAAAKRKAEEEQRLAALSSTGLFTIRSNTEAITSDVDGSVELAPSLGQCETRCASSAACKIFTHNKSDGICYMYSRADFKPNEKFDSGIRK